MSNALPELKAGYFFRIFQYEGIQYRHNLVVQLRKKTLFGSMLVGWEFASPNAGSVSSAATRAVNGHPRAAAVPIDRPVVGEKFWGDYPPKKLED